MEACRAANVPEPGLRYEPPGLWVEFSFPEDQWGSLTQGELDEKLRGKRVAIVRLMKTNPKITISEIAEALQISRTAADKNIQIQKSKGHISRRGPAKGGHWVVLK